MSSKKPNSLKLFFYSLLLGIYFVSVSPAHFYIHGKDSGIQIKKECKVCEWQQSVNSSFQLSGVCHIQFQNTDFQDFNKQEVVYFTKKYFTQLEGKQLLRGPPMV